MNKIDRRKDTDNRILESAIRCFAKKGYTYSSLADIAKDAGVTAGLVSQRYGSKEMLFSHAYNCAMSSLSDVNPDTSPRACLVDLLEQIKELSQSNPDSFLFHCMLHNSTDLPRDILLENKYKRTINNRYKILLEAQKNGILPDGDLDALIEAFCTNAFNHISLCKRYNLEVPDNGYYFKAINFVDQQYESLQRWHTGILSAITNIFDALIYLDLVSGTADIIKINGINSFSKESYDIHVIMKAAAEHEMFNSCREWARQFFDTDTLSERIGQKRYLENIFIINSGVSYGFTYSVMQRDGSGKATSLILSVYRVED